MMRALGFLVGVGLTVTALLLVLDQWHGHQRELVAQNGAEPTAEELSEVVAEIAEQVDMQPAETAAHQAMPPAPESGMAGDEPPGGFELALLEPDPHPELQAQSEQAPATEPEAVTADGTEQNEAEHTGPASDHAPEVQAPAQGGDSDHHAAASAGSYLFWSPFRSVWAARGFAGRLTSATQVPVEVVHVGPGQYRVAFDYRDETERLAQIERIETITGLKLE